MIWYIGVGLGYLLGVGFSAALVIVDFLFIKKWIQKDLDAAITTYGEASALVLLITSVAATLFLFIFISESFTRVFGG